MIGTASPGCTVVWAQNANNAYIQPTWTLSLSRDMKTTLAQAPVGIKVDHCEVMCIYYGLKIVMPRLGHTFQRGMSADRNSLF